MPDPTLIRQTRTNLLMLAKKSIGSPLFRNMYVRRQDEKEPFDVLEDGTVSCAVFVSTLLTMVGLIERPHFIVASVIKDMEASGWQQITRPRPGAVVTWAGNDDNPPHIGIVVEGDDLCIANSSIVRTPQPGSLTMNDGRQPDAFYWHSDLEQE